MSVALLSVAGISFTDDFLVEDVIFYHGSATSFVIFILVSQTPLKNGFLGVWGWRSFSDVLLLIPECCIWTQSLHSSFYSTFLSEYFYFDDSSSSVITIKRPMHLTLYLCKCHPNYSNRPGLGIVVWSISKIEYISETYWKGWLNVNTFHISMRLLMFEAVGCTVLSWE